MANYFWHMLKQTTTFQCVEVNDLRCIGTGHAVCFSKKMSQLLSNWVIMKTWTWGVTREMERNLEFWVFIGQYLFWPNWAREEKWVVVGGRSQENSHKLSKDSSRNLSRKMVSLKEIMNLSGKINLARK